jgi:WD40 repeat protein
VGQIKQWESIARFTLDGKQMIGTNWNVFNVYDLATGKRVGRFVSGVQCWNFSLSRTGTRLLNATPRGLQVWDWSSGKKLCDLATGPAVFTPDGRYILHQRGGKPPLLVLDAETGREVNGYRQLRNVPRLEGISSDGKRLLCGEGRIALVYDMASGKEIRSLDRGPAHQWAWLVGDGRRMLTNIDHNTGGLWDVDSGRLLAKLQFPESISKLLRDVQVSADGKVALFAVNPDTLYVFRLPAAPAVKP